MRLPDEWTVFPLHRIESDERSPLRVGSDGKEKRLCGCLDPTCANAGKHPATGWGELPPGGKLIGKDPRMGLGLATGARSGCIILDMDLKGPSAKHPNGLNGVQSLMDLGVTVPETLMVATPSGGYHCYFNWPGWKVKDSAGLIAPGVDIRGDGGYVVIPDSEHDCGGRYQFLNWGTPMADMPDWLSSRLARSPGADDAPFPIPDLPRLPGGNATTDEGWRLLDRVVKEILDIPCGQRNERLFQKVAKLGDYVYLGHIDVADAKMTVLRAVIQAGWADPQKTSDTIDRALKGSSKGRVVEVSVNHRPANDRAIEILAYDEAIYVIGDALARDTGVGISAMTRPTLEEILSANVDYRKKDKDGNLVPCHPPPWATATIYDRKNWPGLRVIDGFSAVPILRPDMSVAWEKGYDGHTRVLLGNTSEEIPMSWQEASAVLAEVVCDVEFASASHRAAWLCAVLTPLAMYAFTGPMPLFMFDGSTAGAGKTQLATISGIIGTGSHPSISTYSQDEAEMRKAITSHAKSPSPVMFFDDVRGEFGGGVISRLVTAPDRMWKDRELGGNTTFEGVVNSVMYVTLNQGRIGPDLERRICPIRLTPSMVRPEQRTGFKHDPWIPWVAENQRILTWAALTLLRHGWTTRNRRVPLQGWGSFTSWRDLVVGACVAAGWGTPDAAVDELREMSSGHLDEAESFVEAWAMAREALTYGDKENPGRGVTVHEVWDGCYPTKFGPSTPGCEKMRAWIEEVFPKGCSPRVFGSKMKQFRDKPTNKGRLEKFGMRDGYQRWRII